MEVVTVLWVPPWRQSAIITPPLRGFFMEEIQNGTLATTLYNVSSYSTTTFQYLEHPWVFKRYLLVLLWQTVSVLSQVNKQLKNIIQRSAPRIDSYAWQGMWDSMGKCLRRWAPQCCGTSPLNKCRILKNE